MQLQAKVYTHVIITNFNTHHKITEQTHQKLRLVGNQDRVLDDDGVEIKGSQIAAVFPISEYYKQYPEKRPETVSDNTTINEVLKSYITPKRLNALQSMKNGFENNFRNREIEGQSQTIYNAITSHVARVESQS